MEDYDTRAKTLGLNTKDEIQDLVAKHKESLVFLDVRGEAEVAEASLEGFGQVLYVPCTRDDASLLQSKAEEILPDKNAHIVVFCRSGARAVKAKSVLEELGYVNVSN